MLNPAFWVCPPQTRWCALWGRERLEKWWSASIKTGSSNKAPSAAHRRRREGRLSLSAAVFHRGERVAVKVVRNIERFREAAKSEIAVLEEINGLDDDSRL